MKENVLLLFVVVEWFDILPGEVCCAVRGDGGVSDLLLLIHNRGILFLCCREF
jgi:hypothetical protein